MEDDIEMGIISCLWGQSQHNDCRSINPAILNLGMTHSDFKMAAVFTLKFCNNSTNSFKQKQQKKNHHQQHKKVST